MSALTLGQHINILPLPSPLLDRIPDRAGIAVHLRSVEVSVSRLEGGEDVIRAFFLEVGGS